MFEKTIYETYDTQEDVIDAYATEEPMAESRFVQEDPVAQPLRRGIPQVIVRVLVLAAACFAGFWAVNMLFYSVEVLWALEHIGEAVAVPAWALLTAAALLLGVSCIYQLPNWKKPVQYPVVRQQMNYTRILLLLSLLLVFGTCNIIHIFVAVVLFAILYFATLPVKAMAAGPEKE